MSAINKHLSFIDLTDFTPGLYTEPLSTKQFAMPQAAAQQMDNCLPIKQGGIRAFYKPVAVSSSGITVASEVPTGAGIFSGLAVRSGVGDAAYRFMTTLSSADSKTRLYRMDESAGNTTWSQKDATYTLAAGNTSGLASTFFPFLDSAGALWMIMVVRDNSTGHGTYKIAYVAGAAPAGDGVVTKLNGAFGAAVANQARVIVSDGGTTLPFRIYYGDVGLTTGALTTLANFLDVAPYQNGSDIAGIVPQEPSDLLVMKQGAPWVDIAGDISNTGTAVREMGSGHFGVFGIQDPVRTPTGICFIEPGGYIYLTDGRQFTNISIPIDRFFQIDAGLGGAILSPGKMAFLGSYLFAPKGYIRDWETGAWFRSTHFANAAFLTADPRKLRIWGINQGNNFDQWDLAPFDRTTGQNPTPRYDSYTWRSAPLTPPSGREARIREVQLFVRCSGTSDFTVTRTDADGTQVVRFTSGITAAGGEQMVSFLFPNSGSSYQDVTVQATAESTSVEAPIIERIRIGFAEGHQR